MAQAEIDVASAQGRPPEARRRMAEFERESRELRRANDILKAISACLRSEARPTGADMSAFTDHLGGADLPRLGDHEHLDRVTVTADWVD